jgi:hypothetical protein
MSTNDDFRVMKILEYIFGRRRIDNHKAPVFLGSYERILVNDTSGLITPWNVEEWMSCLSLFN